MTRSHGPGPCDNPHIAAGLHQLLRRTARALRSLEKNIRELDREVTALEQEIRTELACSADPETG